MKGKSLLLTLLAAGIPLFGQGYSLDSAELLKPLSDNWTSYSGDYSGRRFSLLKNVTVDNVKNLSLAWANTNITMGCGPTGASSTEGGGSSAGLGRGAATPVPIIIGGLGDGSANRCGAAGGWNSSGEWRHLWQHPQQRLCPRRSRWGSALAPLLESAPGPRIEQSRRRHVAQLRLL